MSDMTIDEALAETERNLPTFPDEHIWDAEHAGMLRWGPVRNPGCGVLTGCDARHEWLLPWWLEKLREHNPLIPVAFANYGMTEKGLKFCQAHGQVYNIFAPKALWFRKPFAILNSPFAVTLPMDPDCEVRPDLTPLSTVPRGK